MATERKKFTEVFNESGESLSLVIPLKVEGQVFDIGKTFTQKEGLNGIDFHILRYLDVGVNKDENGVYDIEGFYGAEE